MELSVINFIEDGEMTGYNTMVLSQTVAKEYN